MTWTADAMGDLTGRTALVTGATSGLGLASAIALAAAGARVLITTRDPERGAAALARVRRDGGPLTELVHLDLADLDSVRRAAVDIRVRTGDTLHLLLNNAGVMGTPPGVTVDGFETQIATNHLGPAALTWLLMPALRAAGAARVVTVSSLAHRGPGFDVDDLHFRRRSYLAAHAYSQSKLANLLFSAELDRRLRAAGRRRDLRRRPPRADRHPAVRQLAAPARRSVARRGRPADQQGDHAAGGQRRAAAALRGHRAAGARG